MSPYSGNIPTERYPKSLKMLNSKPQLWGMPLQTIHLRSEEFINLTEKLYTFQDWFCFQVAVDVFFPWLTDRSGNSLTNQLLAFQSIRAVNDGMLGCCSWLFIILTTWVVFHPQQAGEFNRTRWAPSSYKWSYNPYKWPYKSVPCETWSLVASSEFLRLFTKNGG